MIGKKLKTLRTSMGLSHRKLAEKSGVSYGHICDIEHNKTNPTVLTLIKLAKALGVRTEELLKDSTNEDVPKSLINGVAIN